MKDQYTFDEFMDIIKRLRSKDGCPWDREQTHESLRPCMMEEAAELVASVRILRETGDCDNLKEELGDVLLQVAMHSQIASEESYFTIDDVITEVSRKMIRRHPHVFGTVEADTSDQVLKNWEEIKKQEKKEKGTKAAQLSEIPPELPALVRARKVGKKAEKLYKIERDEAVEVERMKSIFSQLENGKNDMSSKDKNEVAGEMLFLLSNWLGNAGIHAEQALSDYICSEIAQYQSND